jgi:hypothetical protein
LHSELQSSNKVWGLFYGTFIRVNKWLEIKIEA